jgi:hypothetical protein
MRRGLSFGSVLVLLAVGLASSAGAKNPGPVGLPAVQATVKDQCTGANVPGFVASVVAGGASVSPSKTTTSGFVYNALDAPQFVLQVSAPGYEPLGGAANPGVPLFKQPGPSGRADRQPGPNGLPGGVLVLTGMRAAVLLTPNGGCAAPRQAVVPAVMAKVIDRETGAPLSGVAEMLGQDGTVSLSKNFVNGAFAEKTLPCGAFGMNVSVAGHVTASPGTLLHELGHDYRLCHGGLGSGDLAVGETMTFALPGTTFNQPPHVNDVSVMQYSLQAGGIPVPISGSAYDPDPADNALLTYTWTSSDPSCTFTDPTNPVTEVSCDAPGNTLITFTVTDPHGATDSSAFDMLSVPPPLTIDTASPLPDGVLRVPYSQTLSASGGVAPYTWSLLGGNLPTGLNLASTGVISGTPTIPGTYIAIVAVTDSSAVNVSREYMITIT